MDLVFFPEKLNERAPNMIGCLALASGEGWAGLPDLVAALRNGESVNIRQASATELQRAEKLVVLYEIGMQLAQQTCDLLDDRPEDATAAVTALREMAEESSAWNSFKTPTDLLDKAHATQGKE